MSNFERCFFFKKLYLYPDQNTFTSRMRADHASYGSYSLDAVTFSKLEYIKICHKSVGYWKLMQHPAEPVLTVTIQRTPYHI